DVVVDADAEKQPACPVEVSDVPAGIGSADHVGGAFQDGDETGARRLLHFAARVFRVQGLARARDLRAPLDDARGHAVERDRQVLEFRTAGDAAGPGGQVARTELAGD